MKTQEMPAEIPVPVTFNPYKHHFHFLLSELKVWRKMEWEILYAQLLSIGNNLIDFYLGDLGDLEVVEETLEFFQAKGITNRTEFLLWLEPRQWKKIMLSDGSEWLIKQGDDPDRYIHIHPAKHSAHTIRVRAATLKTVLALEILMIRIDPDQHKNRNAVNSVRKERLGLSPVKSIRKGESGILRLWELFEHHP